MYIIVSSKIPKPLQGAINTGKTKQEEEEEEVEEDDAEGGDDGVQDSSAAFNGHQ